MTRSASIMLALLLAAPLPVLAATTGSYKTVVVKTHPAAAKTVTLRDGL